MRHTMRSTATGGVAVVLALALTSCGSAPEANVGEEVETGDGSVVTATFDSGLTCDVFDTTYGGGIDCDFASLDDEAWGDATGEVERISVQDGEAAVVRFEDAHVCVTFQGAKSGGMTCHYPPS